MTRQSAREAANDLEGMTDRLARKGATWWMALFNLVLLGLLVAALYWNATLLQTTIRQNSDALVRTTAALERVERALAAMK